MGYNHAAALMLEPTPRHFGAPYRRPWLRCTNPMAVTFDRFSFQMMSASVSTRLGNQRAQGAFRSEMPNLILCH
jgi:hypothetical protein